RRSTWNANLLSGFCRVARVGGVMGKLLPGMVWSAIHWDDSVPGADRAPGRCRAGEGVAWRHYLTDRFVSWAYVTARAAGLRRALSAVPFFSEVGRGLVVDPLQGGQRAQDGSVALAPEVAEGFHQGHPLRRRQVGQRRVVLTAQRFQRQPAEGRQV